MNNGRDCDHGRRFGNCDSCDLIQAENTIVRLLSGKWDVTEYELISSTRVISEIRAEAGRAGYLQGVYDFQEADSKHENFFNDSRADEYAAKIRKGEQSGTWLKDSNVNGGKRQGGEWWQPEFANPVAQKYASGRIIALIVAQHGKILELKKYKVVSDD